MNFTLKSVTVVGFMVGTMASQNAMADPFHGGFHDHGHRPRYLTPLQRMALRLTSQTHDLNDEIDIHCTHTPRYEHLSEDAKKLEEFARHVRSLVNRRGSAAHIQADVLEMSELADHMDEIIHDMLRRASRPQIHIGNGGVHVHLDRRDREGLEHIHEEIDVIRTVLYQMDREISECYPGVDGVLDQHALSNRSAVEVRPVVISPRSTGLNLNFRLR